MTRPLPVDSFGDTVRFRNSGELASSPAFDLVEPPHTLRLALYIPGRFEDGWLGLRGSFQLWPDTDAGLLSFELTGPQETPPVAVELGPQGGRSREVIVQPGRRTPVSVPVCGAGPWTMEFVAPSTGTVGGRYVSVPASEPVYRVDPAAC